LAYATRIGLEIGADIIKVESNGNKKDLEWAVKSAGKARVVIAGGSKENEEIFLEKIKEAIAVGVTGIAVGRNIWQSDKPLDLAKKLKKVIWK